mgnify:CR=1 FL=1
MAKAAAPAGKTGRKKSFRKKREKKHIPAGLVFIRATFNNTQVTITDMKGNTIGWASSGSVGFKGSRKGTPFAAGQAATAAATRARDVGMRTVEVRVNGPGSGRVGHPLPGGCRLAGDGHQRCHPDPAQRLSAAQAASGVMRGTNRLVGR